MKTDFKETERIVWRDLRWNVDAKNMKQIDRELYLSINNDSLDIHEIRGMINHSLYDDPSSPQKGGL